MNVLVISENYTAGGLETHINTYYKSLRKKIKFTFAFSKYKDNGYLEGANIYTGLNLGFNVTIEKFCSDVKKLVDIIKKEKIDVIHAHPFYSIFPAIFAANITNTKLVYTYHGYGSINFVSNINDTVLFMFAVESRINKIFCVASNVLEYFKNMYNHNAMFLPNLIYEEDFPIHEISKSKKWALISRLDSDKYPSIIKFLGMTKELDISQIDIYGSGDMEVNLKKYIKDNKLGKKVFLKGYINNLNENLNDYTGTIGLGRVVQESLCMNYPTIFIGYGKVAGCVDKDVYNSVKTINFVPASLDDIEISEFKKQINEINKGNYKKYQLRNTVIKDFGISNTQTYMDELKKIKPDSIDILNKIYNDILNINNKEELFYNSREVFNILYNRLAIYSKNIYFKNLLVANLKQFELIENYDSLKSLLNDLNNKLSNVQNNLNQFKTQNDILSDELNNYKKGKLYRLSDKIYSFKSKFKKRQK